MEKPGISVRDIALAFLKIGFIGFGGGSALIPVVEREFIKSTNAMPEEDYLKHTVVANITPGALPVKLGATCGLQCGKAAGGLLGAACTAAPGVLLTVGIMALFGLLGENAITYFRYASVGVTWFIVYILLHYIHKTVRGPALAVNLTLCGAAFVLTAGKELREIVGLVFGGHSEPLLDISAIDLMMITIFLITLRTLRLKKGWNTLIVSLSFAYLLLAGKLAKSLGLYAYSRWLPVVIAVLLLVLLTRSFRGKPLAGVRLSGSACRAILVFLAAPVLCSLPVALSTGKWGFFAFIWQVCVSTLTSFGGGEAYVSVADGIFVQEGYVSPEAFYTQLVPVANALPGPILVKIAAGIGYIYGAAQNALFGWAAAMIAAMTAIGACSSGAVLVMELYDNVRESALIRELKLYILPVICGMLLSTSSAMLFEGMKIAGEKGVSGGIFLAISAAVISLLFLVSRKRHVNDLVLLPALVLLGGGFMLLL